MSRNCSVIFAGGKTGGHLFPGVAVAEKIKRDYPNIQITFIGLKNGLESRIIPPKGWDVKFIPMETPRGKNILGLIKFLLFSLPASLFFSIKYLLKIKPILVIGLGGYPAFPVILAAKILIIKTVLFEQNVVMGLTNRVLSNIADKIFVSYPIENKNKKYIFTGNPTRDLQVQDKNENNIVLGILGGSQGASKINKLMINNLDKLEKFKDKISVIHQTGKQDYENVKKIYSDNEFPAKVIDFIDDMGWFYSQVDLLISRAGASTIAELVKYGKSAIFIPFPFAANNHQEKNALYIEKNGGGFVFPERDLMPDKLFKQLEDLINNPDKIREMNSNIKKLQSKNATDAAVNNLKIYLEKVCLER